MADRVVLARIEIDESGAVRSVKATTDAVGNLEKQTKGTADVFTSRMFNMKTAAAAFLGTFTLAGGVLAFKSFVTSLFEAQENFKAFSESASKTATSLAHIVGDITGMNQALADTTTILETIRKKTEESRGSNTGWLGILWTALWGETPFGKIEELLHLTSGLLSKGEMQGPPAPPGLGGTPYDPTGDAAEKAFQEQRQAIMESGVSLSEYNLAAMEAGHKINKELYESAILAASGFEALDEKINETTFSEEALAEPSRWQRFKTSFMDAMQEMAKGMTVANLAIDAAVQAAQSFANAFATGILEGGLTWKSMIAEMLKSIGLLLMAWGSLGIVMSFFGYEPGLAASSIAFAAGAAALAASRALSPRGADGSQTGGFGGSPALAGGGGNTFNITVMAEGSNPEVFGRRAALAIKRALADGSAGGSL